VAAALDRRRDLRLHQQRVRVLHRARRLGAVEQVTEERFWLRARLEQGGYVKPPRIRMIVSNAIDAYNHETVRDEILGSSDASPLQQYKFLKARCSRTS